MRSGLFLPLFDQLADPALVAGLAPEAEEARWHGVFVWDHVRWREPVVEVADPWITLAAIATATASVRLGPMVTPLARRRPVKVARETATLDRLSGGRLTLGVGLGSDKFGSEYSMTGEEVDDRRRARMLEESLGILAAAWSGEPVHHRGEHPVNLEHPEQLAEIVARLTVLREEAGEDAAEPYDVVAAKDGLRAPDPADCRRDIRATDAKDADRSRARLCEHSGVMLREFDARLEKGDNPGAWTCIVMQDAAELFGTRGLVKIRGAIDGEPFDGALMAQGDGTHRLPVRSTLRKAIGKEAGDTVHLRIDERIG